MATFAPSFLLLVGFEPYFDKLKASRHFARASQGIMSCFVGLLVYVTYTFAHGIPWDAARGVLVAAALVALLKKVQIPVLVLVGAASSLLLL